MAQMVSALPWDGKLLAGVGSIPVVGKIWRLMRGMVRIQLPLPSLGGKSSTGSDPQALPSKNAPDRNFGRFTWYCGVMATGSLEKGEVRPGIESRENRK